MRTTCLFCLLASLWLISCHGDVPESRYAGKEASEIKTLSQAEIQGLLAGHGMGFARAAELNQHPGPKHVLELADELRLSKIQIEQTKQIYDEMHAKAVRLGKQLVDAERRLDAMFAHSTADDSSLTSHVLRIGEITSRLRLTHLQAHLRMTKILSEEQIRNYDLHRGYVGNNVTHDHPNRDENH